MNFYPISSLFFYRAIFMAWLLFGEALFLFRLKKKWHFLLRTSLSYLICFGFAFAFPIPTGNSFYTRCRFFCRFFLTYGLTFFRYRCGWRHLLFSAICGYTTEHIAYETYFAIANFAGILGYGNQGLYSNDTISIFTGPLDALTYFCSFFIVFYLVFLCFANRMNNRESRDLNNSFSALAISSLFLLIDIVINSLVSYYGTIHYDTMFRGFIALVNALCCLVALMFAFQLCYKASLQKNLAIIEELRKEEKNQYELTKETIDLINIKCHDRKHQLRGIAKKEQMSPKTIQDRESLIQIYDSSIKTDNPVLDVILTEKSLFCNKREIKFSCIADGSLLNFRSEEDLYSLFGNIIDNAIEAVKDLPLGQRIISLKIVSHGNRVSISEKNSFSGKIRYSNGMPITSKNDSRYHGFGLKSIKMVVEKYKGTFTISDKDNLFTLSLLLFPEKDKVRTGEG